MTAGTATQDQYYILCSSPRQMSRYLLVLLAFVLHGEVRAQRIFDDSPLMFRVPPISVWPLPDSIPSSVRAAYAYIDSVCRTTTYTYENRDRYLVPDSFPRSRETFRHYYLATDYDPLLFRQWSVSSSDGRHKAFPRAIRSVFVESTFRNHPDRRAALLLNADMILHVRVVDTFVLRTRRFDEITEFIRVTAEVVDPIKGKRVPDCVQGLIEPLVESNASRRGTCVQFAYRTDWLRADTLDVERIFNDMIHASGTLQDSEGRPWIKPGTEYIVFLQLRHEGLGNAHYFTVWPADGTTVGGMYPVEKNVVLDTKDDFGFGKNLSPAQWKQALRQRIQKLLSM